MPKPILRAPCCICLPPKGEGLDGAYLNHFLISMEELSLSDATGSRWSIKCEGDQKSAWELMRVIMEHCHQPLLPL